MAANSLAVRMVLPTALLSAATAPGGAAVRLRMILEQNRGENSPALSGRLHGLTGALGICALFEFIN